MNKKTNYDGRCLSRREFLKVAGGVALGATITAVGLGCAGCAGKKSASEITRDDYVIKYQILSRPKIEELLGAENYERCCSGMLKEYDVFASSLPVLEDDNNHSQFYNSAPFMLSLYRTLLGEFAFDQDEALDLLNKITCYKVREDYKNRFVERFFLARIAESEFIRELGMKKLEYRVEQYGWAIEFPESNAHMAFDMTRCGLADWFRDQGVPEIAPIACEGDYVTAEFYTGLELIRTKTIAGGDEICDFRYVKEQA